MRLEMRTDDFHEKSDVSLVKYLFWGARRGSPPDIDPKSMHQLWPQVRGKCARTLPLSSGMLILYIAEKRYFQQIFFFYLFCYFFFCLCSIANEWFFPSKQITIFSFIFVTCSRNIKENKYPTFCNLLMLHCCSCLWWLGPGMSVRRPEKSSTWQYIQVFRIHEGKFPGYLSIVEFYRSTISLFLKKERCPSCFHLKEKMGVARVLFADERLFSFFFRQLHHKTRKQRNQYCGPFAVWLLTSIHHIFVSNSWKT